MGQAAADKEIKIGLNTVILACLERGLAMQDIRQLPLGHAVDFVIDYNRRQKEAARASEHKGKVKHYRLATKDEVDALVKG